MLTASVRYPLARPPRRGRGCGQMGAIGSIVARASKLGDGASAPQFLVGFYNVGINQQQLKSEKWRRKGFGKASDVNRLWASGVDVLVLCEVGDHEEGHSDIAGLSLQIQRLLQEVRPAPRLQITDYR